MNTHYPLQDLCLAIIVGSTALASFAVALRFFARHRRKLRYGWDDWLVLFALLFAIGMVPPSWLDVKLWNKGIHIWDVPPDKLEPGFRDYYPVMISQNILNTPILPLAKASILVLLFRIASFMPWLRRCLYAIMGFNIITCVIPAAFLLFECPLAPNNSWEPRTFGNLHCVGRIRAGYILVFINCVNLFTDIIIFPIPFLIMQKVVTMRRGPRLITLILFASSLLVTGITAAKIYTMSFVRLKNNAQPNDDWTYNIDYSIQQVENSLAIIIACVPIMRQLASTRRGVAALQPPQGSPQTQQSERGLLPAAARFIDTQISFHEDKSWIGMQDLQIKPNAEQPREIV